MNVMSDKKSDNSIVKMSYCALCVTLAFVLSKLTLPFLMLPFGGKITLLSMFIISIPGYAYGMTYGFVSATALGLLKVVMASHANHPASLLLDYFLPYFVFGLTGFSHKKSFETFECLYMVSAFLRFLLLSISGCVLWASYCPTGWNILVYAIVYNGSYVGIEVLLTLIVINLPMIKKSIKKLLVVIGR